MPDIKPFDLATVLTNAEQIKGMRQASVTESLRQKLMGTQQQATEQGMGFAAAQEARAAAGEQRQATQFTQEQQVQNTRLLNVAAKAVAADPSAAARWIPQLQASGVMGPNFDPSDVPPAVLQQMAAQLAKQTDTELAAYLQANPAMAEIDRRHTATLAEIDARARAEGRLAAQGNQFVLGQINARGVQDRETEARRPGPADKAALEKSERQIAQEQTFKLYETARDGLLSGLSGAVTGPAVGRIPAVTAGAQIAEGGVAAMAPVLKQLFRVAGEGTFTDKDQELLLQMVPTRKDLPESRVAKVKNIDNIVRAKLGLPPKADGNGPQPGAVEDGFRFKGGNPADPNSWEPAQ